MQSLACVAADVVDVNSFSLLPLGLAWMTRLHFSLDQSLSQMWKRSTFISSTATLDITSTNSTSTWQIDPDEKKKGHKFSPSEGRSGCWLTVQGGTVWLPNLCYSRSPLPGKLFFTLSSITSHPINCLFNPLPAKISKDLWPVLGPWMLNTVNLSLTAAIVTLCLNTCVVKALL